MTASRQTEGEKADPVGVLKDLGNLAGLRLLRVAHHGLGRNELHKGELALQAHGGRQGCFASARRALQQACQQWRPLTASHLCRSSGSEIWAVLEGKTRQQPAEG